MPHRPCHDIFHITLIYEQYCHRVSSLFQSNCKHAERSRSLIENTNSISYKTNKSDALSVLLIYLFTYLRLVFAATFHSRRRHSYGLPVV